MKYRLITIGQEFSSPDEAADWAIANYNQFLITDHLALWHGEYEWLSEEGLDFLNYVFRRACRDAWLYSQTNGI